MRLTPAARAFKEIESAVDVGGVAGPRIFDGAWYGRQRGNVKNEVDVTAGFGNRAGVAQVALDEFNAIAEGGEVFALAGFEVVEAANRVSAGNEGFGERFRKRGADKPGAAGD